MYFKIKQKENKVRFDIFSGRYSTIYFGDGKSYELNLPTNTPAITKVCHIYKNPGIYCAVCKKDKGIVEMFGKEIQIGEIKQSFIQRFKAWLQSVTKFS
jgi:hypothetical protein